MPACRSARRSTLSANARRGDRRPRPAARQCTTTPPSAARSTIIRASSSRSPAPGAAAARRRRPLRPAAHAARRRQAHPRRRLLRLARPHRARADGCSRMTITLAIPSKGRLREQALERLATARAWPSSACRRRPEVPRPHRGPRRHRGGVPVGLGDRGRTRPRHGRSRHHRRGSAARERGGLGERRPRSPCGWASAMPTWWWRCPTSGSTSTP